MRRLLFAVIAVGVVFGVYGVAFAQEEASPMPERVRAFLDNMTGTWTSDQGDIKGTSHCEWSSQNSALVGAGQVQGKDITGATSDMWHWDGVSEDGVIANWGGMIGGEAAYGQIRGKVLSETSMQGQVEGLLLGSRMSGNVHVEFQGRNQYTWRRTNTVLDGEPKPDLDFKDVITRVKPTSDEQELVRLDHELAEAVQRGDIDTLNRLIADDFTFCDPGGKSMGKHEAVGGVSSGAYKVTSMSLEDLKVRVYGNMAINTGLSNETSTVMGVDTSGRSRFTETWIKRDGQWQCIAAHVSEVSGQEESIEGIWEFEKSGFEGTSKGQRNWRALKIYHDNIFLCTVHNLQSKKVTRTHGGTYTFDGNVLKESVEFATGEPVEDLLGETFSFVTEIKNGKLYQSGKIFDNSLEEVWKRANK